MKGTTDMMARIRKAMEKKEEGFTLVELLVVIIIIGILAAIAIPLYLNQQQKARDAALKSDLKNAQIEAANQLVDDPTGASIDATSIEAAIKLSPDVTLTDVTVSTSDFSICGTVDGGTEVGEAGMCIDASGQLVDSNGDPL